MSSRIPAGALGLVCAIASLIRLAPSPLRLTSTLDAVSAGSAPAEAGVVALVALVGWLCATWLLLAVALTAVGLAPGVVGCVSGHAARRVTPRVVRRAVEAAFGLSVVAGSLSPVAAYADPPVPFESASPVLGDVGPFDRPVTVGSRAARPTARPAKPALTPAPTPTASRPVTSVLPSGTPSPVVPPATSFLVVVPADSPSPGTSDSPVSHRPSERPQVDRPAGSPASADLLTGRPAAVDADEFVVVRRGDTLWSLAAARLRPSATPAEIDAEWRRWYAANRAVVGADPDLILPGQRLRAPGTPSTTQATTTRSTP
jgi:hypothetical protein